MSSCREEGATILGNTQWKYEMQQTKASKREIPIESKGKIVTVRVMKDQRSLHREAAESLSLGSPEFQLDLHRILDDIIPEIPAHLNCSVILWRLSGALSLSSHWTAFRECRQEGGKIHTLRGRWGLVPYQQYQSGMEEWPGGGKACPSEQRETWLR